MYLVRYFNAIIGQLGGATPPVNSYASVRLTIVEYYATIRIVLSLPCSGGQLLLVTALLGGLLYKFNILTELVKFFVAAYSRGTV